MLSRIPARVGLQLAKNRSTVITGLLVIVLLTGLYAVFGHGKVSLTNLSVANPFESKQQAAPAGPDCSQIVVNLMTQQPQDLAAGKECLNTWGPVARMSDAEFASFVQQNITPNPTESVRMGSTNGVTSSGRKYTVNVFVIKDGYPETVVSIFTDETDHVVNIQ